MSRRAILVAASLLLSIALTSLAQEQNSFAPFTQWGAALASGDMASFAGLYSKLPPVTIKSKPMDTIGAENEVAFWDNIRNSGMRDLKTEIVKMDQKPNVALLSVHTSFVVETAAGPRTRYVNYQQLWQKQSENWVITQVAHSDVLKMRQPSKLNPSLYQAGADAKKEIDEAIAESAKDHKRIILVFGGNWCYDCHVLDTCFHQPDVAPVVDKNFHVIHVDIGREERKNEDLVEKYGVPLNKGVPALAVLDSNGKLLYSQQNGEFESARSMDPDDVINFLNKWKRATK